MDTYLSYEGLKEKYVNSPCQSDDKENVETNIPAEEPNNSINEMVKKHFQVVFLLIMVDCPKKASM